MIQLARVILREWVDHLFKCECEQYWPARRRMFPLAPQDIWSQQVIREMGRFRLRTCNFFDNGQRQLIRDERNLYWRKTRKHVLKMAELYRVVHLPSVYV
jgi:hypothetical protein